MRYVTFLEELRKTQEATAEWPAAISIVGDDSLRALSANGIP